MKIQMEDIIQIAENYLASFPGKESYAVFKDKIIDFKEGMIFRHASSTMNMLLVQEGGVNTMNPDPKL